MSIRPVKQISGTQPTMEGAGVKLHRVFGFGDPSMTDEIQAIVDEINNRPMRVLGYRTPAEAFADELLELQDQQGCCTSK